MNHENNGQPVPIGRRIHEALDEAVSDKKQQEKPADALVRIGRGCYLFHDLDGAPFAECLYQGRPRILPITSTGLGRYLRLTYLRDTKQGVTDATLGQAIATLAALAEYDGPPHPVFARLGSQGKDLVVLDLADIEGRCVVITPAGWAVAGKPPVCLWQPQGMRPLPLPKGGGSLAPLWGLVNIEPADRVLVAAWLLMCLHPRGPYPGLFLHGEQGSAKSTTAEFLRSIIDPNRLPLRSVPRDEDALLISARNGLVVGLDNLSHIDQTLSDSLCRLMTGGGIGKRRLFTDADEVILEARRPVLVTGIPDLATAGDLADRVIALHLPQIPEGKRRLDDEVKAEFERLHPGLLGALLDAAAVALREHRRSRPPELSRMADFEVWAVAGLGALGFDPETFRERYRANKLEAAAAVVDSSPVASALQAMMRGISVWEGTAAELLAQLAGSASDDTRDRSWPKSPRGLAGVLKRLAPALRKAAGIEVVFGSREGHQGRRILTITREARETPSAPSAPSAGQEIPW